MDLGISALASIVCAESSVTHWQPDHAVQFPATCTSTIRQVSSNAMNIQFNDYKIQWLLIKFNDYNDPGIASHNTELPFRQT